MTGANGKLGVLSSEIIAAHPKLYHMAAPGSWPSIKKHGLLSTAALLDLFQIRGSARSQIEEEHRPDIVTITHPKYGSAEVRDQKPMDDRGLGRALEAGMSPRDWYLILNSKVFFWLTESRLKRLREAKAYKDRRQTIITVSTAELLAQYASKVWLAPMNTGCTKPMPHPRGKDTFCRMPQYPYENRVTRGLEPIVELAVDYAIPNVGEFVLRVEENGGGKPKAVLWSRP